MDNENDQALLERYRNGDRAAFTELVVRYQRPLYNAAFWVLRSVEDANDITQIVFLKVAEQLDDYDPQYKFFSWIYRIAVNEALNVQRRRAHEDELDDDVDIAVEGDEDVEEELTLDGEDEDDDIPDKPEGLLDDTDDYHTH